VQKFEAATYMMRQVPCTTQVLIFSPVNTLTNVSRLKIPVCCLKRPKFISMDWVNIELWTSNRLVTTTKLKAIQKIRHQNAITNTYEMTY
jgi:hypothetical protein